MRIRLKKYTIRLPEGLPDKLTELTGLPYNQVIRLALNRFLQNLERRAAEGRLEAVTDTDLVESLERALQGAAQ